MNVLAKNPEFQNAVPMASPVEARTRISVIGLGYVGAVSAACLASLGHEVVGVDIDPDKANMVASGRSPIHEHDLERLLTEGVDADLISATTDIREAISQTEVTFVSVGTPTAPNGGCDFTVPDRGSEKPTPFRRPGSAAVAARLGAWRVTNEAATRFGTVSTISYGRRNTGTRCSAEMSACVVGN